MSQVIVDITMSLDGYVTGPGADLDHGLGIGGEPLHTWAFDASPQDNEVLENQATRTGAVIMGRRTFDVIDGPHGWTDKVGYAAELEPFHTPPPVFVVTHTAPATWRLGDRFTFVTDGLRSAVDKARAAAGDKDVVIMGGGATCHAFLEAGLADLLTIHLAPMILGDGTRLFPAGQAKSLNLEPIRTVSTQAAQHLTYRVSDH
jgi:dihydrofolate reductase